MRNNIIDPLPKEAQKMSFVKYFREATLETQNNQGNTMEQIQIFKEQYEHFEHMWQRDVNGVEFIYARDLQKELGYSTWQKFQPPIKRAINACNSNKIDINNHFNHMVKMVQIGSSSQREIEDIKLTRYASYLITMNGDPRKLEIAFAQNYFAVQTRKFEKIIKRMEQIERIEARNKFTETEKELGRIIYQRGIKDKFEFGRIKSKGDEAFWGGKNTKQIKQILNIPGKRPLADYTNKAVTLGKALANTLTSINTEKDDLYGETPITNEHVKNNKNVRQAIVDSVIHPEKQPAEQDIKKVKQEIQKETRLLEKQNKKRNNFASL